MSIYTRHFFKCKSCGYKQTNLAQVNRILEGPCPDCGDDNVDYMKKADRDEYARDLFEELKDMLEEEDAE